MIIETFEVSGLFIPADSVEKILFDNGFKRTIWNGDKWVKFIGKTPFYYSTMGHLHSILVKGDQWCRIGLNEVGYPPHVLITHLNKRLTKELLNA